MLHSEVTWPYEALHSSHIKQDEWERCSPKCLQSLKYDKSTILAFVFPQQ